MYLLTDQPSRNLAGSQKQECFSIADAMARFKDAAVVEIEMQRARHICIVPTTTKDSLTFTFGTDGVQQRRQSCSVEEADRNLGQRGGKFCLWRCSLLY